MIGISTTFFAIRGLGIYDSVAEAKNLGFGLVELGAAHAFEKNIPKTLKAVKRDFPELRFTIHGLFPPLKKSFWFNPSEGLTTANKKIVENFFDAAQAAEAELVSFHGGFKGRVLFGVELHGLHYARLGKEFPEKKALANALKVFSLAQRLSEQTGICFAVENQPRVKGEGPLFFSAASFKKIFSEFPNSGLLLDFGHALFSKNLEEMLQLKEKVRQLHLHYSRPKSKDNKDDEHSPIVSLAQLRPLSVIKQLDRIPLVFEHGRNVSTQELSKEKQLLELFLKKA